MRRITRSMLTCVVATGFAATGCADGRAVLLVKMESNARIRAVVENAGQTSLPALLGPLDPPLNIPPTQTFSLTFDKSRSGAVSIFVDLLDRNGTVLASATATGDVEPGRMSEATLTFGTDQLPDSGTD